MTLQHKKFKKTKAHLKTTTVKGEGTAKETGRPEQLGKVKTRLQGRDSKVGAGSVKGTDGARHQKNTHTGKGSPNTQKSGSKLQVLMEIPKSKTSAPRRVKAVRAPAKSEKRKDGQRAGRPLRERRVIGVKQGVESDDPGRAISNQQGRDGPSQTNSVLDFKTAKRGSPEVPRQAAEEETTGRGWTDYGFPEVFPSSGLGRLLLTEALCGVS